jgi:hypothetical protein
MRRGTRSKLSQNSSTNGRHHPLERGGGGQVLQPAHGGLRAQLGPGLGQPADSHLERRVGAQGLAVVGIRVAGGDQQRPKANHLGQPMPHPLGRPWILEAAGQALGDPQLALDLGEHQHARVRGQTATVEGDTHRLPETGDRSGKGGACSAMAGVKLRATVAILLRHQNLT